MLVEPTADRDSPVRDIASILERAAGEINAQSPAAVSGRAGRKIACNQPGCPYRGKPTDLKRHKLQHTNTRPFRCRKGCQKIFNHPSARCRHEKSIHGTAEYYQCDFPGCSQRYKDRVDNLWQHQQRDHCAWELFRLPKLSTTLAPALAADPNESQEELDADFDGLIAHVMAGFN